VVNKCKSDVSPIRKLASNPDIARRFSSSTNQKAFIKNMPAKNYAATWDFNLHRKSHADQAWLSAILAIRLPSYPRLKIRFATRFGTELVRGV
jgi:hypothetical protein